MMSKKNCHNKLGALLLAAIPMQLLSMRPAHGNGAQTVPAECRSALDTGTRLFEQGEYAAAAEVYHNAAKRKRCGAMSHFEANAYIKLHKPEEALQAFKDFCNWVQKYRLQAHYEAEIKETSRIIAWIESRAHGAPAAPPAPEQPQAVPPPTQADVAQPEAGPATGLSLSKEQAAASLQVQAHDPTAKPILPQRGRVDFKKIRTVGLILGSVAASGLAVSLGVGLGLANQQQAMQSVGNDNVTIYRLGFGLTAQLGRGAH